jgi:hypothetical protein
MASLDLDDLDLEEKRLIETPPELALCLGGFVSLERERDVVTGG